MPPYLTPATAFKEWPYASTRAIGQFDLFVFWRPKMVFRRLCSILSAFWTEEWNSCAVQLQPDTDVPVKSWSEALSSAAPRKARRLGSSRELTGVRVERQAPVRPELFEDGPVGLNDLLFEGARAGVENGFYGRGEASSVDEIVACVLGSTSL